MYSIAKLTERRNEIIGKISEIKSMRKGILNTQYKNVSHKNGDVAVKGPYYVLTKKGSNGKTISQSISAKDAEHIQEEVDNYKRFRQLSDEYVDVCETISLLQGNSQDDVKKN